MSYLLERLMEHGENFLTAHHEAGHAVAALMRGGGELLSITIEPTAQYAGFTRTRHQIWDAAFVTFAGPWAEARATWGPRALDDIDDDGCCFGDYVTEAWFNNLHGDGQTYQDNLIGESAFGLARDPAEREDWWSTELDDRWPVIQAVALLLLDGERVDHATVDELLTRHSEAA